MKLVMLIAASMLAYSVYLLFCDLFKVPSHKTTAAMQGLQKQLKKGSGKITTSLEEFSSWIAKHIRLNDVKRAKLEADLITARVEITPERWVANSLVKSVEFFLAFLPAVIATPKAIYVSLALGVVAYLNEKSQLRKKVKQHREALEYELPRLVYTIDKTLPRDRNILAILESYQQVASPDLQRELEITIADMRTGSQETAITRLETRVGSVMMSDVCRGLLSALRGDDTAGYWTSLNVKFSDHQRNLLKARAEKIPTRVTWLSLVLVGCYMVTWIIIMLLQMVQSMGEIF